MMRRSAPAAIRRCATRSMMGVPATSTSAFGMSRVISPSRVPRPAARIIASMSAGAGGARAPNVLAGGSLLRQRAVCVLRRFHFEHITRPRRFLTMLQRHVHLREFVPDVRGQPLRKIYRTMLTARAPEADAQTGESAAQIFLDLRIRERTHVGPVLMRFTAPLDVFDDTRVPLAHRAVLDVPPGIW